ncbi:MAG TPA: MFS transporter [Bacillota bacterium]|nr:MFS transporter [Bacillota bacterium]
MNKRVYFLMMVSFVVGMVELIISGILDLIANDFNISLGQAGLLITIFSLIFAIAGPILLVATAKVERKRLTLIFLFLFFLSNIVTILSPTFSVLFLARILTALSGSLLVVLCLVMAPEIVEPAYRGRAIGVVTMGISGSIVLGVPIGLVLGNNFGWQAPFVLVAVLTLLSMVGVFLLMKEVAPKPSVPLRKQLATLKNKKIFFAHLTMFLFLAGHMVLYAYLKPFITITMGLEGLWVTVVYFLFGIAAVSGGGLGGTLADRIGTNRAILSSVIIFGLTLFVIPYATAVLPIFLIVLVVWGMANWSLTPSLQSYLIETAPETSDVQQSLNNSALHFGIAFGSFIGGIVIEHTTVLHNPSVGGIMVALALGAALISMYGRVAVGKQTSISMHK